VFAAAAFSLLLAGVSLLRKGRSLATWCFAAGMALFAVDSLFTGLSLRATELPGIIRWLTLGLIVKSLAMAPWLSFSLAYSRGDCRDALARWKVPLLAISLLPVGLALGYGERLLEVVRTGPLSDVLHLQLTPAAQAVSVVLLIAVVLVLLNLEQTYRAAVGTLRWRIKFVVLGLAVIFGARLYVRSQAILFSGYDMTLGVVESSGLLVGGLLLVLAYFRTGLAEIDVYPSRAILRSSITILVVGGYLFVVGGLARLVERYGGTEGFQLKAFVVLLGMAGLALLLLSDRLSQRIRTLVARHFRRAQHDSTRVWSEFSRRLGSVSDQQALCNTSAKLVSEAFDALSVTIWVVDEQAGRLVIAASTHEDRREESANAPSDEPDPVVSGLRETSSPFDLEKAAGAWAHDWRSRNPSHFPNGGHRWCVPLRAGDRFVGALVLADRVNGARYTEEEIELLSCIADHVTSTLLNLRLAEEVARSRELEAFRTMSAFFVHDLKNAAASLNLMLKNLPAHFDDPAFRQDALRAIGNTAGRIDTMIARLSALRRQSDFKPVEVDLNQLVSLALDGLDGVPAAEMTRDLQPLPRIMADGEQLKSVVTNLVVNARDATGPRGRVQVRTRRSGAHAVLTVTDDGCGMSTAFLKDSLFKPFQSTKKKGLGIGMFQSRMIVERHGGTIQVESAPGKGTTVRASFPVQDAK